MGETLRSMDGAQRRAPAETTDVGMVTMRALVARTCNPERASAPTAGTACRELLYQRSAREAPGSRAARMSVGSWPLQPTAAWRRRVIHTIGCRHARSRVGA
jgi:hypothetical protein